MAIRRFGSWECTFVFAIVISCLGIWDCMDIVSSFLLVLGTRETA